jgi:hypothetical protein
MNTVAGPLHDRVHPRSGFLRGLVTILPSVKRRELALFLLIGLVLSGINATSYFEWLSKVGDSRILLTWITQPVLVVPFLLAGWLIADRADSSRVARTWRLVLGATGGSLVAALLLPHMVELIGLPFNGPLKFSDGKTILLPDWMLQLVCFLDVATFAGLSFAALEMSGRRRRTEQTLEIERREQTLLARQLLESRLAAMQAQVEPQFLFDALVDIERLYARDAISAAGNLDHLIQYLRVALPRLRESGSSIQAEVELVESYLAVVQALHDGQPRLRLKIDRDSALRTFYPMLLLPLVQRAVRRTSTVPDAIDIKVAPAGSGVGIIVRIASPALCNEDGELERVRERLKGLYGGRATLTCVEPGAGVTEFALQLPA